MGEPYQKVTENGNKYSYVDIKFIKTGSIRSVRLSVAKSGQAKDMYAKDVYGIGCKGNVQKVGHEREYRTWRNMLSRCYVEKDERYSAYGAKGVTVDDRWLCFENFVNDLPKLPNYDSDLFNSGELCLDKDLICENKNIFPKIYSKDTCTLLTNKENMSLRKGVAFKKSLPDKPLIKVTNIKNDSIEFIYDIKEYCKQNNIPRTTLYRKLNKDNKSNIYNGLRFERINYNGKN